MTSVEVSCYNCSSSERAPYTEENGFMLVKCAGCGLLYMTPRPSDEALAQAHECGVHQGDTELDVTGVFVDDKIPSYVAKLRELFGAELGHKKRTWLDIGCGHGEFLVALDQISNHQISACGIEPNIKKQESARSHGQDVTYFDLAEHSEQYDVVSMLNVYSHLPNPPEFIRLCKRLLKPGGELLLQTGDTANLAAGEHPRPLYLPDHLSFASEEIVCDLLRRQGFEIVAVRKFRAFPFKRSLSRWTKEIVKCLLPWKKSQLPKLIGKRRRSRKYITDMYVRARLPIGQETTN